MDLEDLFDSRRRDRRDGHGRDRYDHEDEHGHGITDLSRHRDDSHDRADHDGDHSWQEGRGHRRDHGDDDELFDLERFVPQLLAHKKLLVVAGIAVVAIVAVAGVFLLPLIGPALSALVRKGTF